MALSSTRRKSHLQPPPDQDQGALRARVRRRSACVCHEVVWRAPTVATRLCSLWLFSTTPQGASVNAPRAAQSPEGRVVCVCVYATRHGRPEHTARQSEARGAPRAAAPPGGRRVPVVYHIVNCAMSIRTDGAFWPPWERAKSAIHMPAAARCNMQRHPGAAVLRESHTRMSASRPDAGLAKRGRL